MIDTLRNLSHLENREKSINGLASPILALKNVTSLRGDLNQFDSGITKSGGWKQS